MKVLKVSFISKILLSAYVLFVFIGFMNFNVFAAENKIYIAGNSDLYPIEYYDSSKECYAGLMPEIYKIISKNTGYEFHYIEKTESQEKLAENCQAEIVSAYSYGDIRLKYIKNPKYILDFKTDGKEKRIFIAFSGIASDELIKNISKELDKIDSDKKLSIIASFTSQNQKENNYLIWIYVLLAVVLLFVIFSVTVAIRFSKRRKENKKNDLIDLRYGIGNDRYFIYSFENLISEKSKSLYYLAYIAFDFERFDKLYGGDESKDIQRYSAEFLNNKVGPTEYLSIIKEGVFTFVYQSVNKMQAEKRIESIIKELDAYLLRFKAEYSGLFNAGVCALEDNLGCSCETALYNAKQGYIFAVGNKLKFAFSNENIIKETLKTERLRKQISQAIDNGEIKLYLQYIVDKNGKTVGAECVSRWQNLEEGLVYPTEYIKLINYSDTITKHDLYIFSKACEHLQEWTQKGVNDLFISCNVTRYSASENNFADKIKEIAEQYRFDYSRIVIEITEDSVSDNIEALKRNIEKCKELGFLIALDDIGGGYTSLADLYNLPVNIVKIEREIVKKADDEHGKMLLKGLIKLAHSMKLKVLCEGVETPQQNETVLMLDCDYIQGFYYSRALPEKEAERFLSEHYVFKKEENI